MSLFVESRPESVKRLIPDFHHHIIALFLVAALVAMAIGMFSDADVMRAMTLAIIGLTILTLVVGWFNEKINGRHVAERDFGVASFYAFMTMSILVGSIFMIDSLVATVRNLEFANFACLFISVIVAYMLAGREKTEERP